MRHFLAIARTGWTSVLLHPLRSLVTIAALVAVLLPYLAGLGIARGVHDEAVAAVAAGADLYLSGERFGSPVPIPRSAAEEVRKVPGVDTVTPRIVGRIVLGKDRVSATVVGVPLEGFPRELECIDGRLFSTGLRNELVVGSDLARRLNLEVGSFIPPFYRSRQGEHISEVVGIFRSDVSFWQARLIVTSLETAARIFDQPDLATELLVQCKPGYAAEVAVILRRNTKLLHPEGLIRPLVVTREELNILVPRGPQHREGVFTVLFVLAFAVAILVVLVTSGLGLSERRREIAILKATGWQTDELMLRSLVEGLLLAVTGASLAILLATVWLKALNGYWIAGVFLFDVERIPGFQVPFRLLPMPVLVTFLVALVVIMSGSLYSTWRTAVTPPRQAMR